MARHAAREPEPLVRLVLRRTVAKVDSIAFVRHCATELSINQTVTAGQRTRETCWEVSEQWQQSLLSNRDKTAPDGGGQHLDFARLDLLKLSSERIQKRRLEFPSCTCSKRLGGRDCI